MNPPSLNQILDITIVLVAAYAALSCVCSWLHEWIATRLALRGWNLFRGISQLVGGDDIAVRVFNHPLVNNTSPKPQFTISEGTAQAGFRHFFAVVRSAPPSYLDSRNFSSSFWQVVHTAEAARFASAPPPEPGCAPLPTSEFEQLAVLADPEKAISALKKTVASMHSAPQLQKSLLALLATAENDYEKLLRATDGWYNAQMDRVSGWYKRRTKTVMFFIALIVVSVAGIDTVHVVKVLSATDWCTLQAVAADAGMLANKTGAGAERPQGSACAAGQTSPAPGAAFDLTQFAQVRLDFWRNWGPGLALTWLAVWLGGPFWFDVLGSLANVRSAGRKPKRTDQPPR